MKLLSAKLIRSQPIEPRNQRSLSEYYSNRNLVLINREIGGLGDVLMHRMLFEDVAKAGVRVHFACPKQYHPAVQDHPFVEAVLDCAEVNPYDYVASYNTTTACGRYESRIAPLSDLHRSDIWARHCGVDLVNHEMHVRLSDEEVECGRRTLEKIGPVGKTVAVCPVSAMTGKNLVGVQLTGVLRGLRDMGLSPFGLHSKPVPEVEGNRVPMVCGIPIRQWMGVMTAADYVVAVDTSAFHLAGGIKKPLVGVFSFADGKTYGKYYDFELVQKHRDDGNWSCGPCYNWTLCPKSKQSRKPCITEITSRDVLDAFERLLQKYPAK